MILDRRLPSPVTFDPRSSKLAEGSGYAFTYAVNGGLTAARVARLDTVGVVTVAMVSGLGGGTIRDILLGALPSATFGDWRRSHQGKKEGR